MLLGGCTKWDGGVTECVCSVRGRLQEVCGCANSCVLTFELHTLYRFKEEQCSVFGRCFGRCFVFLLSMVRVYRIVVAKV